MQPESRKGKQWSAAISFSQDPSFEPGLKLSGSLAARIVLMMSRRLPTICAHHHFLGDQDRLRRHNQNINDICDKTTLEIGLGFSHICLVHRTFLFLPERKSLLNSRAFKLGHLISNPIIERAYLDHLPCLPKTTQNGHRALAESWHRTQTRRYAC